MFVGERKLEKIGIDTREKIRRHMFSCQDQICKVSIDRRETRCFDRGEISKSGRGTCRLSTRSTRCQHGFLDLKDSERDFVVRGVKYLTGRKRGCVGN